MSEISFDRTWRNQVDQYFGGSEADQSSLLRNTRQIPLLNRLQKQMLRFIHIEQIHENVQNSVTMIKNQENPKLLIMENSFITHIK